MSCRPPGTDALSPAPHFVIDQRRPQILCQPAFHQVASPSLSGDMVFLGVRSVLQFRRALKYNGGKIGTGLRN